MRSQSGGRRRNAKVTERQSPRSVPLGVWNTLAVACLENIDGKQKILKTIKRFVWQTTECDDVDLFVPRPGEKVLIQLGIAPGKDLSPRRVAQSLQKPPNLIHLM